jgi:hypothetical protein
MKQSYPVSFCEDSTEDICPANLDVANIHKIYITVIDFSNVRLHFNHVIHAILFVHTLIHITEEEDKNSDMFRLNDFCHLQYIRRRIP